MARKGHSKKRGKGGKSRKRKRRDDSQPAPRQDEAKFQAKKPKLAPQEQDSSSDSGEEADPFTSLLSTFNATARTDNVVETDESEPSDSEVEVSEGDREVSVFDQDENLGEEDDEVNESEGDGGDENDSNDDAGDSNDKDEDDFDVFENQDEAVDDVLDNDPFVKHLLYDLDEDLLEVIQSPQPQYQIVQEIWPALESLKFYLPDVKKKTVVKKTKMSVVDNTIFAPHGNVPSRITYVDLAKLHVKSQLHSNVANANVENIGEEKEVLITPLQKEIFSIVNNYQDLFYPSRTLENGEEIRFIYTLHSVNHILKTRTKIVNHNIKVQNKDDVPDEYRDQGLVRPKVLILVPFKDSAYRIIKMIISLLHPKDKGHVINKARFIEEFTGGEIAMPFKNPRPEDYEKTFSGNADDNFKIGLAITRKSLKLYVDFYSADIIIASPLGLRVIIGAEGEANRDYDFLASIEVLIMDQTEIFLMQNWEHVLHIMNHIHLQPKESHNTDFARVRSWAINGWTRFYRQTLVFSSLMLPEINSLFNKKCHNFAGKARIEKFYAKGSVCQIVLQLSQVFHRFSAISGQTTIDARFEFFTKKILPQFTDSNTNSVLIYVPSYFDYVRIRNYFKREEISFVQICEYSKDGKIARARDHFFRSEAQFLLYSERAHFFRRFRIKGIRHLIFYQPPTIPHFYSEFCNFMADCNQSRKLACDSAKSVTVMYAKSDGLQLAAIVGTERAARMLSSDRDVHMFVSGD
ncbi:hypothetical protein R5R35_002730 [Gryllus longicercus]|uniref:U3 small nucleolar RNA-associated protein 25 homolog n=1 Tax=Gryllus longicercus TaxID=2509291 RepID=A0AAN9VJR9_9ORTH